MMFSFLRKEQRLGFTLVELLIVIIIIGILAGMLLLAVGSATDKAEAAKIVNLLRNYKSATMMYYGDNDEWPAVGAYGPNDAVTASIDRYLDRSLDATLYTHLLVDELPANSGRFYVGLRPTNSSPLGSSAGVRSKLAAQAQPLALLQTLGAPYTGGTATNRDIFMPMR